MIDPVTRIAAAPVAPATPAQAQPEPQTATPPQPEAKAAAPAPLSLDVAQGAGGVFVYTLKDPGTGTVLAVIPRQDVEAGRDGRNLDQRI